MIHISTFLENNLFQAQLAGQSTDKLTIDTSSRHHLIRTLKNKFYVKSQAKFINIPLTELNISIFWQTHPEVNIIIITKKESSKIRFQCPMECFRKVLCDDKQDTTLTPEEDA